MGNKWNDLIKKIPIILALSLILFLGMESQARAGFGDFNDYDSGGSDWGSSDWGSSDYGSNDYSGSYFWNDDYSSSGESSGGGSFSLWLIVVVVIIIWSIAASKKNGSQRSTSAPARTAGTLKKTLPDRTAEISSLIQEKDPLFTAPDFISFVKQVYVDIQDAWSKRDLEPVRAVLHQNLYQQTEKQIEKKIADGIINYLERISVNTAYLTSYRRDTQFEYLTVYLAASMIDYQVKEATGQVLYGDKSTRWNMYYKMTFMRSASAKTRNAEDKEKGMICPNCGAPLKGTSFGKCEYCDSIVTTGAYDWVLSDFGVVKDDTSDDGIQVSEKD